MKIALAGRGVYLAAGLEIADDHDIEIAIDGLPEADLLVCLAYPRILKASELARYPLGAINYHCGLPYYRGRHPLPWMLIHRIKRIPCAFHWMDDGVDTGDILVKSYVDTDRNETYASLLEKVLGELPKLLTEALALIATGAPPREPQPAGRTLPRRTPEDSRIDWDQPAASVHAFINALSEPMPNATDGIYRYVESDIGSGPGQVLALTTCGRCVVSTKDGVVLVKRGPA